MISQSCQLPAIYHTNVAENDDCNRVNNSSGFSLVELLVALVISGILLAAIAELFVNITDTNREMAKTNSQIENARYAMQFLGSDLVHAGYWGGFVPEWDDLAFYDAPTDYPAALPDPCAAFGTWTAAYADQILGLPVQVYNATPGSCGSIISNKAANTDIVVVRHAETCVAGVPGCQTGASDLELFFQVSNCAAEIDVGSYYALDPNSLPLTELDCTTLESKRRFVQNLYYIRDYSVVAGDGIPTLMRSELRLVGGTIEHQPVQALVEGIERFSVEVGLDLVSDSGDAVPVAPGAITWANPSKFDSPTNRGDGVPETYVSCGAGCNVYQLANVVTVRLNVLARANEPSPGYVDNKSYTLAGVTQTGLPAGYKRHVFSQVIRINNVSGRRETPL
jgi:type IV pilus assembly protein PilW